jgi:hypothetical protein
MSKNFNKDRISTDFKEFERSNEGLEIKPAFLKSTELPNQM